MLNLAHLSHLHEVFDQVFSFRYFIQGMVEVRIIVNHLFVEKNVFNQTFSPISSITWLMDVILHEFWKQKLILFDLKV